MSMDTKLIETTGGPVVGRHHEGVDSFLGIPYAAAPVGERRFLPPAPHARWTEPFEASAFGPTALQEPGEPAGGLPVVPEPIIPGDDYLNLNVWRTASPSGELKPVLVWIHGGGFFAGCSANPWYDGSSFARHGLVVVSINYRLGAEGFLVVPGIERNLAVLDWIAALEWVRENIAAFGGDASQVTLMGQSAGGMAVTALLASPRASGLFSRAIIASGVSSLGTWTESTGQQVSRDVLARAGASADAEGARATSPEAFIAAHAAVSAQHAQSGVELMPPWGPVVDGDLVTTTALDAARQGLGADIPVLIGSTQNEFAWRTIVDASPEDPDFEELRREGQRLFADDFFRRDIDEFARARVATRSAPTFRYEFQWRSGAAPYIGAAHSLDIPFFFNTLNAPYFEPYAGPNPPQELADAMHGAFADFALTGDPGWPEYDTTSEAVMLFDTHPRVSCGVELED